MSIPPGAPALTPAPVRPTAVPPPHAASPGATDDVDARRRRRPCTRRVALAVALVAVLGLTASVVLLTLDVLAARSALASASARVPALEQALAPDGDDGAPTGQLEALQRDAATARARTDGPLWAVARRLPQVGPNLGAVAVVAAGLDDVAIDVVPALVDTRSAVSAMPRTADGGIDLAALSELAPRLAAAQAAMTAVSGRLAAIDPARLLPEVSGPLVRLRAQLADVGGVVATADRAAALVPPMLGADGPRSYLVLALTNAELRSGGGLPGAVLLVRAEAGHVEVLRQVPGVDIGPFASPVAELDPETAEIFTPRPALFVQDVTLTPEFPAAAALAARMWALDQGEQVDGVLATDPVALGLLLGATGPVEVPVPGDGGAAPVSGGGTMTIGADNAVAVLEHGVYGFAPDAGAAADGFFGAVVGAATARVTAPGVDPAAVLGALATAARQHRLQVWSAHPEEQARLTGTVLAGTFLSSPRAADAVGVFLDDTIAGKMSWFLRTSVTYVGSQCTPGGRVDTLDVTLTSTAPADGSATLPTYVAGWPNGTFTPGNIRTLLRVAGPVGSPTPRLRRDGVAYGMDTHPLAGRSMASGTIDLAPGQTTTVTVTARASASASAGHGSQPAGTLDIWSTPTAHDGGLRTVAVPVCARSGETG